MKFRLFKAGLLLVVSLLILMGTVNAALASTLSGIVFGGSNPLGGAPITLTTVAIPSQVLTTTTDSSGQYSFTVSDGTYNMTISPPSGSIFSDSVVKGITVSGGDVTQNVVLMSPGVVVSGTLRNQGDSSAATNAVINFNPTSSGSGGGTWVDSNGKYSITVTPGTFSVEVRKYYNNTAGFYDITPLQNLTVSGSLTQDVSVAFPSPVTVSGRTTDANGVPVGNVNITGYSYTNYGPDANGGYFYGAGSQSCQSDGSGQYSMSVLPYLTYLINVYPPQSGNFVYASYSLSVTADTVKDFALTSAATVSGTVRNQSDGAAVTNTVVYINATTTNTVGGSAWVDSNGKFSIPVSPGTFNIEVHRYYVDAQSNTIGQYDIVVFSNVSITGSKTQDLVVAFPATVTLSGKTTDSSGNPVANVSFNVNSWDNYGPDANGGYYYGSGSHGASSDANGQYSFPLLPNLKYTINANPNNGNFVNTLFPSFSVTADTVKDLVLASAWTVDGTVRNLSDGSVVTNAMVNLNPIDGGTGGTQWVDANGHYSIPVSQGTYNIEVRRYYQESGVGNSGLYDITPIQNLSVTTNTTQEITVAFPTPVTVSGKTTDANSVPIGNVQIGVNSWYGNGPDANGGYVYGNGGGWTTSDQDGKYSFTVLSNWYNFTVYPLSNSNFLPTYVNSIKVAGNLQQNYVMSLADVPPNITSAPQPSGVTDKTATIQWSTEALVKGSLFYGTTKPPTTEIQETATTKSHSVSLSGLSPNTTYYFMVTAVNGAGTTTSDVLSFITSATKDTTPPNIYTPVASSLDATSAIITWSTDKATTGRVSYGVTQDTPTTMVDPNLSKSHSVRITGLSPQTDYFFKVSATDAAGNGPTVSGVVPFTTLAAADTTPPNVTSGPMAVGIGEKSVTITWTTDEPATSGVSWNVNGTNYGVLQDSSLSTNHTVTVTGLTAGTTYNFTVSSTDASGNGPSLQSGKFTTLIAADNYPPVFTLAPLANQVTDTTALITWRTDKGASCTIKYGKSANFLDQSDVSTDLLTKQNRTIYNLSPGTQYFFQVVATDVNGNVQTSKAASFTTDSQPATAPPTITVPGVIAYSSDRTAVITFSTSTPCDATVRWGLSNGALTNQATDPNGKDTKHTVFLSNLTPGTSYRVQMRCTDVNGLTVVAQAGSPRSFFADTGTTSSDVNPPTVQNLGFTTQQQADVTPPAITTAPAATAVTNTTAVITWVSDKLSDSQVFSGLVGQNTLVFTGDIAPVTNHAVTLTNLVPGTTYEFKVQSTDPSSNSAVSAVYTFTTATAPDVTSPVISNLSATGSTISRIHVTWTTNKPATTMVKFGTSPSALTAQSATTGLATSHDITIYNLVPGTTYYLAPVSTDSSGNSTQGVAQAVTLAGSAPVVHTVTATASTGGSITPSSHSVFDGYQLSLAVLPSAGYLINSISGCGGTLVGNAYTTAAVTSNCQVSVTFSADPNYVAPAAPVTKAYPAAGTYAGGTTLHVQLISSRPAAIYYTVDGSVPTLASKLYSGSLAVSGSTTIRYFATDSVSTEAPKSSTYSYLTTANPAGSFTGLKDGNSFTVSRSEAGKAFTTVVANMNSTSFTDSSVLKPNTIYQYAVTSDTDATRTVFMTIRTPMYNGWNIIAVPYATAGVNTSALFNGQVSGVYKWMPSGTTTEASSSPLGSYSSVSTLTPGNGYFVKSFNGNSMVVSIGTPGASAATVTLKPGWTMIANPTTTNDTGIATNWLVDGGSLSSAITANKIGGGLYWWNGTTYDSWSIVNDNPQVEPWKGYWMINLDTADHTLTIQ